MFLKKIITILSILSIAGCFNENVVKTISLNPKKAVEIKLSEIADSVKYIKLQTNSESSMGLLGSVIIKEKYIYIQDISQDIIFIFDKGGKLIAKLDKKGGGPEEYRYIDGLIVSNDEKYIEIIDIALKKIFVFENISFNLIEKKPFIDMNFSTVKKIGGMYYFSTHRLDNLIDGEVTNADLIVFKNGKPKALFDKRVKTEGNYYFPFLESLTANKKTLYASLMFDNTFYEINKMNVNPLFRVDFGINGIDNSIGQKTNNQQISYLENHTLKKAKFPILLINNSNLFLFYYQYQISKEYTEIHYYFDFKKKGKVYHTKKIANDLTDFPNEVLIGSTTCVNDALYKNYLVNIIEPHYWLGEKDSISTKQIGVIKIDDNPIIMLIKLKE